VTENCSLSIDQSKALEIFANWLDGEEVERPFLLSGFAGSGKTYLARKFLQIVEGKNICWTIAAPTHKAVDVLRKSIEKGGIRATWYPSTIHRLLRLRLKRRGNQEVCEKTSQTDKSLEQLGLVLVDEASMVDSNLLEIVLNCAHLYKTRLVFVGDPAQLPPVGEDKSAVFSLKRTTKAHLNEVIRHHGPVLKLANFIRAEDSFCNQPPCFLLDRSDKGLIGAVDQDLWLKKAKSSLRSAAEGNNHDDARILCYTNRYLERLVPHARRAVHGQLADEMSVIPGEVLISRRAVMTSASIECDVTEDEPGILFGSNTEMIVEDVINETFNCSEFDLKEQYEFNFPEINTYVAKVSSRNSIYSIRLMPNIGSDSRLSLDEIMQLLVNKAKSLPKQEARIYWKYFFSIRDSFAFVGPASVLTVHRSQGSTFKEVYIAADIFFSKDLLLRRQLAYVAVSRASKKVWMVGNKTQEFSNSMWEKKL